MKNTHFCRFSISALMAVTLITAACSGSRDTAGAVSGTMEINWITNIDSALTLALEQNKPVMIDFMATWCPPCKMMDDSTFSDEDVIVKAGSFITVRIDVDKQQETANAYNSNAGKYGGIGIPNLLFLDPQGNTLAHPIGFLPPENIIATMDSVLAQIPAEAVQ